MLPSLYDFFAIVVSALREMWMCKSCCKYDSHQDMIGCDMYDNNTIVVESQVIDNEEFSSVCLSDGTETWSMDFTDWNGLIDLQVDDRVSIELSEMLAHVLYEITWWGFTRESINQQARELENTNKDNIIEVDWSEYIDDKI